MANLKNSVSLVGRGTKDWSEGLKYSNRDGGEQLAVLRGTVAVDRPYKKGEERTADFISVIAFGKLAEFIAKNFHKGDLIQLHGSIQTGSYTNKDGQKVYTTDVLLDAAEFIGGKTGNKTETETAKDEPTGSDFMQVDGLDDLPF